MTSEKLVQRLMGIYLSELEEHLGTWPQHVVALEGDDEARAESLRELYRVVHSLKGASRSVRLPLMVDACHHLETWIGGAQSGERAVDADFIALLVSAGKVLGEVRRQLTTSRELEVTHLPELIAYLEGERATLPSDVERGVETPQEVEESGGVSQPEIERYLRVASRSLDALLARQSQLSVVVSSFDALQRELEELVAATPWRSQHRGQLEEFALHFRGRLRTLRQTAHAFRSDVLTARMIPLNQACESLEIMVRDVARAQDKRVRLELDVSGIELDRAIFESIQDPLRHLVRNAVDHGVETPEAREAAGKSAEARVMIRGELRGGEVAVSVEDDGRGLDLEAIAARVAAEGGHRERDVESLTQAIFRPGFTTAQRVTEVSGRGVGLDVVRARLARIHGRVDVESRAGEGSRFTLTVPLTLTLIRGFMVCCCGDTFALPGTVIERVMRIPREQIGVRDGMAVLEIDGARVPVLPLSLCLGIEDERRSEGPRSTLPVVLLRAGPQRMGFIVERFEGEREIVVMSLGPRVVKARHVSGATIAPSGEVVLILNGAELIETGHVVRGRYVPHPVDSRESAAPERRARVLVVDDSITARSLLKAVLETEGYAVVEAVDGLDAWEKLKHHEVDLVVSDVEMPRASGFELLERLRSSEAFSKLPAVLVTGRSRDEDRARGLELGANAYLAKSAFDSSELLSILHTLLGG